MAFNLKTENATAFDIKMMYWYSLSKCYLAFINAEKASHGAEINDEIVHSRVSELNLENVLSSTRRTPGLSRVGR